MNTPRLALLALLALCAFSAPPALHAADLVWDRTQNGDAWQGITFTDENGVKRGYFYRIDDAGANPTLYSLTKKADPLVKNSVAYEAAPSAYKVTVTVTGWWDKATTYKVTRAGTPLNLTATAGWTIGKSLYENSTTAQYTGEGARRRRTDVYDPAKYTVVVGPPLGTGENLDPTPMTNFQENVSPTAWGQFYFDSAPTGRGAAYPYEVAKKRYADLRRRVYPFEVIYDPTSCFVSQTNCSAAETADIAAAAEEAAGGNLRTVDQITKAGHARIKAQATALRAGLDTAPEDAFGTEETALLQRLLANYNHGAAFNTELNASRGKPETLKQFVAKWRGYLKSEIDAYLKDPNLGKSEEPNRVALRKAQADRIQAVVAAPKIGTPAPPKKDPVVPPVTGPNGRNNAATKPAFDFNGGFLTGSFDTTGSAINKTTPGGEWYVFSAAPEKAGSPALSGGLNKVYCHIGPLGLGPVNNPMDFVKKAALEKRSFECVILKQPEPKPVAGKLEAEVAFAGSANFVTPVLASLGDVKMSFAAVPLAPMTLSGGRPSGVTMFTPKRGAGVMNGGATTPGKDPAVVPPGASAGLPSTEPSPEELAWLSKTDAEAYKSAPATPERNKEYRGKITENLKPGAESAAYAAAVAKADATKEQINATLPKEPYGGAGNKEVIGPTGPKTAVQLTEEEYKKLKPADRDAYDRARAGNDGNASSKEQPKFSAAVYDPIALHAATVAARATITTTPANPATGPAGKPDEALVPPLTPEELALLTPAEKKEYEGMLTAANATPANASAKKSLSDLSKKYRGLIATEGRKPYPAEAAGKPDFTPQNFDDMQPWQKRRFCAERPVGAATLSTDQRGAGLGGTGDARAQLTQSETRGRTPGPQTSENRPAPAASPWDEKCKGYRDEAPVIPNTRNNLTGTVPGVGPDAEVKEEVKKPWISAPLLIRGAQGALVGLLIGSLFGPVGLIAGPLIGAALFYGVSKYMRDKEADKGE